MRIPLQYQIMWPLSAVAIVGLVAVGALYARLATQETQAGIARQLQGVVRVLATTNFPLTEAVLRQMTDLSGAEFVLVDGKQRVIAASLAPAPSNLPSVDLAGTSDEIALGQAVSLEGQTYFHSAMRLNRPIEGSRTHVLHVLFPRESYNAAWRRAFLPPLVVGVIAVLAVGLVTHVITNRVSRNLSRLGNRVKRLAEGEYQTFPLPSRDDEVRDLASAVNQTALRLSEYELHVRQTEQVRTTAMLGAGLAHEMRNAATGCRLAVDLHAENCPASDDDSLSVAKSQLLLMESRLQRFLRLGRESSASVRQIVDFGAMLNDLIPLILPAARHAGVRIELPDCGMRCNVLADADSLSMVIVNLLMNAVEAAQAHKDSIVREAVVSIAIAENPLGMVELTVSDTGAGVPESVNGKLFEPFVTTKPEGVGLGLAVARQVVTEHGGEIDCRREMEQTSFRLRLPLAHLANGA